MLAYSSRKSKRGGGSIQQPLDYIDKSYGTPNAPAGQNLLVEQGGIARPMIGGFFPSVMKGVVNSGAFLGPLVAIEAKRMMNGNGTRKRRGGGTTKQENWKRNFALAGELLRKHGKARGPNITKYAVALRKDPAAAAAFLEEFKAREFARQQEEATKKTRKAPRKSKAQAAPVPGAIRHVFFNNKGKILGEEVVPPGQLSKLVVNVAGKVRNITEQIPVQGSFTIGDEIPVLNNAPKTKKKRAPKGTLAAIAKEVAKNTALEMPVAVVPPTGPRISEGQAKYQANLAAARAELAKYTNKPLISNAATLVRMKRQGQNTGAFIENYKTRKGKKNKGPLTTIAEGAEETINLTIPPAVAAAVEKAKRTRKVTNEQQARYAQAKANLASLGRNPFAYEISTLSKRRREGKPNAELFELYKQGPLPVASRAAAPVAAVAPAAVVNAVKQAQAQAPAPAAPAEAPGLLQTVMSMVAPAAAAAPVATTEAKQKRAYKRSNEVQSIMNKAKANLVATGRAKGPKAQEIATLTALRRRGENNSRFMNEYMGVSEPIIDLDAVTETNEENENNNE